MTFAMIALVCILFSSSQVHADIMPQNSHSLNLCARIVNTDAYPDYVLVAYLTGPTMRASNSIHAVIINSTACLYKGYKFNTFHLIAFKKDYLDSVGIAGLNFSGTADSPGDILDDHAINASLSIDPYGEYVDDGNHLVNETIEYSIVGISDRLLLFKSKELLDYNDGTPPQVVKIATYENASSEPVPSVSVPLPIAHPGYDLPPQPRGFWESIGCFFKSLFGAGSSGSCV